MMNAHRLARIFGAIGLSLLLTPHSSVFAEQASGASYPPVEQASFHQVVFADDDLAVLNNLYPPGGDSGFHAHYRDVFFVMVQPAESSGQSLGGPLRAVPAAPVGTAAYSPVGVGPRVHRIINGNSSTYHIVVIELRRAKPLGAATSSRDKAPQYVPIFDNPRMTAWRLILEPGQTAPAISQVGKGVRVVVRGGLLTTIVEGIPDQSLALRPGDFAIQPVGFARALRNGGTETIELVEIELK